MSSAHNPSLIATFSLTQSVFQLCGSSGMVPFAAVDSGDFMQVASAKMPNPLDHNDPCSYAKAYQAWNLLRKFDSFPINVDRQNVASSNFDESEVSCGQINRVVDALPYVPGVQLERQQQSIVESARGLIKRTLGKFDLEELQMVCSFSSGASTRVPRKRGNTVFKLDGRPHVTINCRDLAVHFIWCNELWRNYCQSKFGRESDPYSWVELTPGSRFETVPKDSLKDRPICIEPDLNMFFQKGIGSMIRSRLKKRGIDLNDQSRNQRLARKGSIDDSLATIDLSSASDSISLRICEVLLPDDWYQMLLLTRSTYVLKDGKYQRLEKVSSMGNGFTFELESLLFWALAVSSCKAAECSTEHLSVYGDDIIVPGEAAFPLISVLESWGFKTNTQKTFVYGPFRESCGKHYFLGSDVTPMKVESPIETWADIYHFCNSLQEWGWADPDIVGEIVARAIKPIPPRSRCFVPINFGSKSGLRVDRPRKRPVYSATLGSFVYKFHFMKEVTNEHDFSGPVAYLSGMLQLEQGNPSRVDDRVSSDTSVINDSLGYAIATVVEKNNWVRIGSAVSRWCDMVA